MYRSLSPISPLPRSPNQRCYLPYSMPSQKSTAEFGQYHFDLVYGCVLADGQPAPSKEGLMGAVKYWMSTWLSESTNNGITSWYPPEQPTRKVYIYAEPVAEESTPRYKAYPGVPGLSPELGIREWTGVNHVETYNGCVFIVDRRGSRVQIPGLGQETLLDRVVFLESTVTEQEDRIESLNSESLQQKATIASLQKRQKEQESSMESLKELYSKQTDVIASLTKSLNGLSTEIEKRCPPEVRLDEWDSMF